jgi:3-phenylpropionate/cinnamic acid dioxygenase small subunit
VARLGSGESISTSPAPRTIRSVSRFRVLADDGNTVTVRCAQNLREFRKEIQKHYTADLTYTLVRAATASASSRRWCACSTPPMRCSASATSCKERA